MADNQEFINIFNPTAVFRRMDMGPHYDLGHGYCTYDFFDQCPHRMACAKCAFYQPKGETRMQLLEAQGHLTRMLQEIPLTADEQAAIEDGAAAMEHLLRRLENHPTPAGPTPRELAAADMDIIPLTARTAPTSGG